MSVIAGQLQQPSPEGLWWSCHLISCQLASLERSNLMAPFPITVIKEHRYVHRDRDSHGHFLPMRYTMQPYSAACVPLRWMLQKEGAELVERYTLGPSQSVSQDLGFDPDWIQDRASQLVMLRALPLWGARAPRARRSRTRVCHRCPARASRTWRPVGDRGAGRGRDGPVLPPVRHDGDRGRRRRCRGFSFVLPNAAGWETLARVTLSGPGGTATPGTDTDQPLSIWRDSDGRVRAILQRGGWRGPTWRNQGLTALLSRGDSRTGHPAAVEAEPDPDRAVPGADAGGWRPPAEREAGRGGGGGGHLSGCFCRGRTVGK